MTSRRFRTSRPNAWVQPRPPCDATMRRFWYGPNQPMDDDRPSLLERIFARRR